MKTEININGLKYGLIAEPDGTIYVGEIECWVDAYLSCLGVSFCHVQSEYGSINLSETYQNAITNLHKYINIASFYAARRYCYENGLTEFEGVVFTGVMALNEWASRQAEATGVEVWRSEGVIELRVES